MPESQTPPQLRLRPVLLVLVCAVVLLTLTQRTGWLSRPYAWVHDGVYAPVRTALHAPLQWTQHGWQVFAEKQDEHALLLQQQQENQELRAQVQLLGHFQAENRRLRMLMDSLLNVTDPVLIAELSDTSIDGYRESRVMLITDTRSRVPVYVARTQQRTLVSGSNGYGSLEMPMLRADSDIQVGDRLVSSGLGGIFPRGYPVAEVTAIERDARAASMTVRLRPLAHLQSMLEVLLLDQRHIAYPPQAVVPVGPPVPEALSKNAEEKDAAATAEKPHADA